MSIEEMRELYSAAPFQPFEIVLPNRSTIAVDHPDFVAFSRDYRTLHFYPLRGGAWHIDVKLIPRINVLPQNSRRSKKSK